MNGLPHPAAAKIKRRAQTTTPKPEAAKPDPGEPPREELEKRIERLEKLVDETIGGMEATAGYKANRALDDSEMDDPLRRAVERANDKREG